MAQSWIKSVLKDLDPSLLDNLSITQEYPRVIIDVNWKVVGLKESANVLNHDMLTIVAEDESGQVFDIMITEPFYPRGVSSLDQLVGAEVVGVNPMVEFTTDENERALLCKYARLVVNGSRKINPHVGVKHHAHVRLCEDGTGQAGDLKENERRAHLERDTAINIHENTNHTRKRAEISRGGEVMPHDDVILRWS